MTNSPILELQNTNHSLSIQLSLNGFSFCIANTSGHIISDYYETSETSAPYTEQELLQKITALFASKPELQTNFKKVEVLYQNELFAFVPKEFFKTSDLSSYLNYSVKTLVTDYITHDTLPNAPIINVFIPYVNVNNFLLECLGEYNYHHTSGLLASHILEKEKRNLSEKVYLYINAHQFDICVTKGDSLLLYNSFTYSNNEDILYYTLFCLEQLKLSPNEIEVSLLTSINDSLYDMLYTYIRTIHTTKDTFNSNQLLHRLALHI